MRQRHRSRTLVLVAVVLTGTLLALPNFFPSDPALLVSRANDAPIQADTLLAVESSLSAAGLSASPGPPSEEGGLLLRFEDSETRRRAADALSAALPNQVVSFTSEPRLPAWLASLGLRPIDLGLDLRGGVQFTFEVDLDAAPRRALTEHAEELRRALREAGIRASTESRAAGIVVRTRDGEAAERARRIVDSLDPPGPGRQFAWAEHRSDAGFELVLSLAEEPLRARQDEVMRQNLATLRNRINALGLSEPVVSRLGFDRILVQIPGARDPAQARRILSSTATIEWHLEDTLNDPEQAPPSSMPRMTAEGRPILLQREIIASGEHLGGATFAYSEGQPIVSIGLNRVGAARMLETTQRNLGRPLAVLLVEETREAVDVDGEIEYRPRRDETVIFVGRIGNVFSSSFELRGLNPVQAQDLALLIRSGSLAAPIHQVGRQQTVSPTLGADNIRRGRNALVGGFVLVVAFMGAYYRAFGLIANLALLVNLVLILGFLSLLPAALTLPGLAGIVLTVGMAVDANVLIFERIREALRGGSTPYASIDEGYRRALSTIADANLTTLLAALALFTFGTGPIQGFAITLGIGVATSMFTAIVGTRAVVDWLYAGRRLTGLSIGKV